MNEEILSTVIEDNPTNAPEVSEDSAEIAAEIAATSDETAEPITPDETPKEQNPENHELDDIRAELKSLREELVAKRNAFERMTREINDFSELFPSTPLSTLPDSVWESVSAGVPLAAAFALYEKRSAAILADAERANAQNKATSTGSVGRSTTESFFSPSDVRAMSREEIRKNYSTILDSMKKWH